ncbi:50S ribosomal protein L29 [Candidatus Dependentiae bacterium]|nr:50S ribosomal protein L29 [Candidatus Dependentiae bacterium]
MKTKKFIEELKGLSKDELNTKVLSLRGELFSLRINSATTPVKDHTQFKKLRKNIARVLNELKMVHGNSK